ncbi:hypothetical protein ACFQZV_08050 [Microbacterium koreense]|uniref:Secreted protein n=1 Tax=Microbacterium koreense TaxID=323761 RepID=A0ABW2ZRY0_9MICO
MKIVTKAALGLAAAGALALGAAVPASAASYPGSVLADGRYVASQKAGSVKVNLQAGCHNFFDTPYVGVYVETVGHSNRPWNVSVEATGGKGWDARYAGDRTLDKQRGSAEYTSIVALKGDGSSWDTRPGGTVSVTLQKVNQDGSHVGDPVVVEFDRPAINCVSVGGAVL